MYNVGDYVIYGSSGVCKVSAIGVPEARNTTEARQYYTLTPVFSSETIYIPIDTKMFMRPVISKEEAQHLITRIPSMHDIKFPPDRDSPIQTQKCSELLRLVKTFYVKSKDADRRKKKLGTTEQRYKKRAETLLYTEFAIALDMPLEDVPAYIENTISNMDAVPAQ